jgi:hypothetical protein
VPVFVVGATQHNAPRRQIQFPKELTPSQQHTTILELGAQNTTRLAKDSLEIWNDGCQHVFDSVPIAF